MVKRYLDFIKESDEISTTSEFTDVVDEVKSMIESTIDESGGELNSFVESYIKNPEDVKIEKFINDSDIYDFYLKWRNDIDEILNKIKFFDTTPTENNAFGLYEFIIKGTQKAMLEFVKLIK